MTAEGTIPEAKLEAFKFVIFVPGPKNPKDVKIPETVTPEPSVISVPVSIMFEFDNVLAELNLATVFIVPEPVKTFES